VAEHSVNLLDRSQANLTGVSKVVTFDEKEIILESSMGFLVVSGNDLHITMLNLDEGKVELQGTVTSIEYNKAQGGDLKVKGRNIMNRLFK
jgi:sporulation protein YabP